MAVVLPVEGGIDRAVLFLFCFFLFFSLTISFSGVRILCRLHKTLIKIFILMIQPLVFLKSRS